ncbi:hypothetical protein [Methanoplanus endosymbiosus]|uniref:Uncharacterized protein n=1 Tax=Methanoplanus endosymbiosus TaxID=33865 RepID=A0A9E7PKZ7_9EURY|nr:hypothetical protein [Methanoplanus endosymbiosus]UUX91232.1 hypothetical protein L6E24_07530 [Methanoplanus endosymbiosus]
MDEDVISGETVSVALTGVAGVVPVHLCSQDYKCHKNSRQSEIVFFKMYTVDEIACT